MIKCKMIGGPLKSTFHGVEFCVQFKDSMQVLLFAFIYLVFSIYS